MPTYLGEVSYRLDLIDHNDNTVATFAGLGLDTPNRGGLHSLSYRKRLRTAGGLSVRIFGDDQRIEDYLRLDKGFDYRWRVFRSDPLWDNVERKDFVGFHRGEQDDQLSTGDFLYTSFSTGPNGWMDSEFIDYPAGSSFTQKSGDASVVAYNFVNENIGPAAGTDDLGLSRVRPRLDLVYPVLSGTQWSGGRAYKLLSDVLVELADIAPADYMIEEEDPPSGGVQAQTLTQFLWSWRSPRWGKDRTRNNEEGNPPLLFSADTRNIQQFKSVYTHLNERNVITVVGQGVGASRKRAMVARNGTIGLSPWARQAVVRDLSSAEDDELGDKAQEELVAGAPSYNVSFQVLQNEFTRYGRDWDIGDLVHVATKGREAIMKIIGVTVTLQKDGKEKITPEFETEWSTFG